MLIILYDMHLFILFKMLQASSLIVWIVVDSGVGKGSAQHVPSTAQPGSPWMDRETSSVESLSPYEGKASLNTQLKVNIPYTQCQ
jgi:hypothetical protein